MEDRNLPATKADLEGLEGRLNKDLGALEARQNERHDMLRSEMQHTHRDLGETIRDVETKLLKAFCSFA